MYVKDVSLTEPTLMNGPKGMRGEVQGNCTIDVIFVINRNFLNKYSENQKILTKCLLFSILHMMCNFIGICQKMSDVIVT